MADSPGVEDIEVVGNYSRVEAIASKHIYVYQVDITNSEASGDSAQVREAQHRRLLFAQALDGGDLGGKHHVVFDGREYAYSAKALHKRWADDTWQTCVRTADSAELAQSQFQVEVRVHRRYDTKRLFDCCTGDSTIESDSEMRGMLYALDSIVRQGMEALLEPVADGRALSSQKSIATTAGFDVWWDYRTTLRATRSGLFVSLIARAVPLTNVETAAELARLYLKQQQRANDNASPVWTGFQQTVSGLRVSINGAAEVELAGLTARAASELQSEGRPVLEAYAGVPADEARWPCAVVAGTKAVVPLHACRIQRQVLGGIGGWQRKRLMALSVLAPAARAEQLQHAAQMLATACAQSPGLRAFGFVTDGRLATVPAQVLPRPTLSVGPPNTRVVADAQGNYTLDGRQVLEPAPELRAWAVVVFASQQRLSQAQALAFAAQLVKGAAELGVRIASTRPPVFHASPLAPIEQTLEHACAGAPQLVVCVLPSGSVALYGEIKRVAVTRLGVHTQCVRLQHALGHRPKIVQSLALKINVKLGGVTCAAPALRATEPATMLLSADVSHKTELGASVVAVVWSIDTEQRRFASCVVQHPRRQEIIENFDAIIRHALRVYRRHTGQKPARIVYLRDGVSDSQVDDVRRVELQAIERGCALVEAGFRPQLTAVIARKRHHARFLRGAQNCPVGTAVTSVVAASTQGFYLIAHHAVAGVARPVYYVVLLNQCRLSEPELVALVYRLSYTYPVVTRAVTMPASLYYAHRLSGRGRLQTSSPFDSLPAFSGGKRPAGKQEPPHLVGAHADLAASMYFM
ncbi:hypothetical protein IWW54_002016 [Coemansia sp. RSA 2705]|nr:hypothetical protein IWW54_002016 [Coemansia sp. RSA 2705]